jgi:hypothetical protein
MHQQNEPLLTLQEIFPSSRWNGGEMLSFAFVPFSFWFYYLHHRCSFLKVGPSLFMLKVDTNGKADS